MKRLTIIFIFLLVILALSGCSLLQRTAPPIETVAVDLTDLPEIEPTGTLYPLGERFKIKDYTLNTPQNWYYSIVNEKNLIGWIFTPEDPLVTAEQGFDGWAGILWLVTPLPEGTDPAALRESMVRQLPGYTDSDLEALLVVAEQAGLLELSDESTVLLTGADVTEWSGQPALRVDGAVQFGSDSGTVTLNTTVYLMWNDEEFLSFYQFSDRRVTAEMYGAFTASRESLSLD